MTKRKKRSDHTVSSGDDTPKAIPTAYAIGYRKPPIATRFKPGQSGNPKGKPKGAKSSKTIARIEFNKKITLHEGSKVRTMTKKEALIAATINRGLQKGGRETDTALRLLVLAEDESNSSSASTAAATEQEVEILAARDARLRHQFTEDLANLPQEGAIGPKADKPEGETQ